MKIKLFLSIFLTALLLIGCQSGDTPKSDTPAQAQTPDNDGDSNSAEGDKDPDPEEEGSAPDNPPVVKEASGWYMRTTAKAVTADGKVYTHKSAGVFGTLEESSDDKDRHDIEAFGSAALYVVFPQEEWDEDNGDYFSDYRHYTKGSTERQVWTFQIKTKFALSDATLKIALQGPYKVFKKDEGIGYDEQEDAQNQIKNDLHLVDVDNDQTYSYSDLAALQLSMENKEVRTFRWVLGTVYPEDYDDLVTQKSVRSLKVQSTETETEREPETKFGFPPAP